MSNYPSNIESIREKWMEIKGKPVDISFPKSAHPQVVKCIVDAARGDVYSLLYFIDQQAEQIELASESLKRIRMALEGINDQDIAETMPPKPWDNGR